MMNLKQLTKIDPEIAKLIQEEAKRQHDVLEMIPSENYASSAVLEAVGSVLANKYSEGYPKKRYYQGNRYIDEIELLAIERAKKLFKVPHVNVQPYSGSPANAEIYLAVMKPGDVLMGLTLSFGGHLTHGSPVSMSGTIYKGIQYDFGKTGRIDFDELGKLAKKYKPKVIVASTTAYPRKLDFKEFGRVADSVGAYLLADISHIVGLVLAGCHPDPVPYAHIIMTTTHKTIRGPRGAMIMVTDKGLKKDPDLAKKIDRWVFPGLQGGPHDHVTAGIAVCLKEATRPSFKKCQEQTIRNCQVLAQELIKHDFNLVTGGTDNHLLLIDTHNKGINGRLLAEGIEEAGIVLNRNWVPNDEAPPFFPNGIRLGTPALSTRGMKEKEMKKVADWLNRAVAEMQTFPVDYQEWTAAAYGKNKDSEGRKKLDKKFHDCLHKSRKLKQIALEIKNLCRKFPVPGIDY
ncbi:serine hydroxymethyltransferase [Candidatus Microgenomates bacterium]|nr:serine hydroxymethyltransferase [Candidatus Microgenomates bacterium]